MPNPDRPRPTVGGRPVTAGRVVLFLTAVLNRAVVGGNATVCLDNLLISNRKTSIV